MFQPPAQLFEKRSSARRIGRFGAHEPDEFSLACRTGRAADWTFDEGRAFCSYRAGKRGFGGGQDGAHVDEELSGDVAVKKTGTTVIDRVQGRRIGKDAEDG